MPKEIFQKGPNCTDPLVCDLHNMCEEASDIRDEIEAFLEGEHDSLKQQIRYSQCQNEQAVNARQNGRNVLSRKK